VTKTINDERADKNETLEMELLDCRWIDYIYYNIHGDFSILRLQTEDGRHTQFKPFSLVEIDT